MPHLELNLAPTAEDMPDMAVALIRAIIAAADQDQDDDRAARPRETSGGDRTLRA